MLQESNLEMTLIGKDITIENKVMKGVFLC